MEFNDFLSWELTTRDTIDFKKIYVDIAGDLIAGLLLSQIIYWHLPSKNGGSKLKSISRDGHYWIAKSYSGWWDEIRISEYQAKRALKLLSDKGLVETKLFKFAGAPTIHTRLIKECFLEQWDIWINKKLLNPFEGNCLIQANGSKPTAIKEEVSKKKKVPLPDPGLGWLKEEHRDLGLAFLEHAGAEYNVANKSDVSLWYKELKTWQAIGVNKDDIKSVIFDMRKRGLSIKSPVSITGMLRDYKSKTKTAEAVVFSGAEAELY